jgi:hypothetical protein
VYDVAVTTCSYCLGLLPYIRVCGMAFMFNIFQTQARDRGYLHYQFTYEATYKEVMAGMFHKK